MTAKQNALERVQTAYLLLRNAQVALDQEQERFAELCRNVYDEHGLNDREIHEATIVNGCPGYSRARIQQFRKKVGV